LRLRSWRGPIARSFRQLVCRARAGSSDRYDDPIRRAQSDLLEREMGFTGGLRPHGASRAKLGREPATLSLGKEDEPEEDQ